MRNTKDVRLDKQTREAWKKNWRNISIADILEIFEYERVNKQLKIFLRVLPKNEKILEGGCGLAPYLIKLRQFGYDVVGIDYNDEPVRKVLAFDPNLPVSVGDVTNIAYPEAFFGGYLSLGVIEHFTEGPEKAIREACRVLKPGGVFIVMVPRNHLLLKIASPIRLLKRNQVLRRLFHKPLDTHYWQQYFGREELKQILEKEGFLVRETHPLDHSHAWATFSSLFRDRGTMDDANKAGYALGAFCEKHLLWLTAAQMLMICYKR